jgi:hypothetical protein
MSMGDEARGEVTRLSDEKLARAEAANAHWEQLQGWLDEFSHEFAAEAIEIPRSYGGMNLIQRRLADFEPRTWEVSVEWCDSSDTPTALGLVIDASGRWKMPGSHYYLGTYLKGEESYVDSVYGREQVRESFVRWLRHYMTVS